MMEQFRMEEGSSLGTVITLVAASFLEGSISFIFSLMMSLVETLLRPWAKKLLFSYRMNLGFTERELRLLISMFTLMSSPGTKETGLSPFCERRSHSGQSVPMEKICRLTCFDVILILILHFCRVFCRHQASAHCLISSSGSFFYRKAEEDERTDGIKLLILALLRWLRFHFIPIFGSLFYPTKLGEVSVWYRHSL